MKYLILALAAMGLFSCTSGKNVVENKSQQRAIASLQDLGLSDADQNGLAQEIENYQAPQGAETVSVSEKITEYSNILAKFTETASNKNYNAKAKLAIMNGQMAEARIRLNNLTGGSGYRFDFFNGKLNAVDSFLKSKNPAGAAALANQEAAIVLPVVKAWAN